MGYREKSVVAEEPSSEPTAKNYSLREELAQNRGILRSHCGRFEQSDTGESCGVELAEREGFEPPIGLHLCRISSAVHSTTLPPLLKAPNQGAALSWSERCSRRGLFSRQGARPTNPPASCARVRERGRSWDRHTRQLAWRSQCRAASGRARSGGLGQWPHGAGEPSQARRAGNANPV
jgi:hypothetical protein